MVSKEQIESAAKVIRGGGLVIFPTETVYGLGANALNATAVAKIFAEKERPSFDPLIVHISKVSQLQLLTIGSDSRVSALASQFWPGPLTMVLPKSERVPDIVTSGLKTVGVRMPNNRVALELIEASATPIAAPSANKFGRISPTTAAHATKQLTGVSSVLDDGPTTVGIESTVISLNSDGFVILREGFITSAMLERVVPKSKSGEHSAPLSSPGLLASHYSPEKPLFILESSTQLSLERYLKESPKEKGVFISFTGMEHPEIERTEFLSRSGNFEEAAANLFSTLHRLEDDPSVGFMVAESIPLKGVGRAIMDKLRRASYRYREV